MCLSLFKYQKKYQHRICGTDICIYIQLKAGWFIKISLTAPERSPVSIILMPCYIRHKS